MTKIQIRKTEFKFVDDIKRDDIEKTINKMLKDDWRFKTFLQCDGSYDQTIGILFERTVHNRRGNGEC